MSYLAFAECPPIVKATARVVSVTFWDFSVALARGGGGLVTPQTPPPMHNAPSTTPWSGSARLPPTDLVFRTLQRMPLAMLGPGCRQSAPLLLDGALHALRDLAMGSRVSHYTVTLHCGYRRQAAGVGVWGRGLLVQAQRGRSENGQWRGCWPNDPLFWELPQVCHCTQI